VRLAAAREIQAILKKQRGIRAWFGNRAKAAVRKVTPKPLHGPLRVKAGAPQRQAPSRGHATPIRATLPEQGARAPHGLGQTMADVKQRARDEKAARKHGQPQPAGRQNGDGMDVLRGQWQGYHAATYGGQEGRKQRVPTEQPPRRQPDAMQQATENMRRQHQQPPSGNGQQPRTDHHGPVRNLYSPDSVLSADDRQARAAAKQARNGQREGRKWGGLHKRLARPAASAPQRTAPDTRLPSERVADNGRTSRARTTA
jgi:hypothetical protein